MWCVVSERIFVDPKAFTLRATRTKPGEGQQLFIVTAPSLMIQPAGVSASKRWTCAVVKRVDDEGSS
jgi:hypothetical protein